MSEEQYLFIAYCLLDTENIGMILGFHYYKTEPISELFARLCMGDTIRTCIEVPSLSIFDNLKKKNKKKNISFISF